MARRAFLLGRNTGTLRYCAAYDEHGELECSDLWLMRDCLERELEFDQVEVVGRDVDYGSILGKLERVTRNCASKDTFVFYFAGHSFGKRGLKLVIADPKDEAQNQMPSEQIIGIIRDCDALSKLVVLDCCEAGKAAESMLPDLSSNLLVLTATDGTYKAQERDELRAGVFTHHLSKALTDPTLRHSGPNGVLDEDGNLCVGRVKHWLTNAVPGYAKSGEAPIPVPYLHGGFGKEIYLATGLEPYRRPSFATDDIRALTVLIEDADLAESQLEDIYEDVLTKSRLRGGYYQVSAPKLSDAGLEDGIEFLVRVGKRSGEEITVPVPLLELVTRLADSAANRAGLKQWCADIAEKLRDKEFNQAHIATLGYSRDEPRQTLRAGYLLIAFEPIDRNKDTVFNAEAWLVDAQGNGGKVAQRPPIPPTRFADFIAEAIGHSRVQDYLRGAREPLCIELMLPGALLDAEYDGWNSGDRPLDTRFPLVLRAVERHPAFTTARYPDNWGRFWQSCEPCRSAPSAAGCTAWLETPPHEGFEDLIEDRNKCLFVLGYRPPEGDLRDMLEDGVTMALWSAKPFPQSVKDGLRKHLAEHPLSTLPHALQKIRRSHWRGAGSAADTSPQPAGVRLLWDDSTRVPRRYGKEAKTGRVARLRNPMRRT